MGKLKIERKSGTGRGNSRNMREETSVARLKTTRCGWHEMGWRESQGPTHQLPSRLCEWSGFYPEYSGEPPKGRKQGITGSG